MTVILGRDSPLLVKRPMSLRHQPERCTWMFSSQGRLPTVTEVPGDVSTTARVTFAATMTTEALAASMAGRYLNPHLERSCTDLQSDLPERSHVRTKAVTLGIPAMPPVMRVLAIWSRLFGSHPCTAMTRRRTLSQTRFRKPDNRQLN